MESASAASSGKRLALTISRRADGFSIRTEPPIVSDPQHSEFRGMTPAELSSSPDVHQNTRVYLFEARRIAVNIDKLPELSRK
jgi:hypothetical protein